MHIVPMHGGAFQEIGDEIDSIGFDNVVQFRHQFMFKIVESVYCCSRDGIYEKGN